MPWRRLLPVALASVVLAAGLTAGFLGFTALTEGSTSNEAADEAAAAAGQAAEVIFTYRFDDLDQYADDAVALMTDDYAAEFEQSAPALGEVAADRPFIVEALVRNSAPVPCSEACTDDRVQVLVFYDQFRLADEVSEPTAFGNRITMTMVRSQGTWLVDDIRAL
ncbi:hypothetical protein HMPREF0063_13065 [Aeromicrobium marinum DSM 15272]|uniref:Mce-associated membrane protein n=1 Tax=Aeromicrobium marinum DSM 15272 TaxID=585531 RepID=E2SGA6_9ACTN|nr:hypothetical protein HMPREF0063_13065 [Aeromicrobium marinum DSM 15272]